MMAFIRTFVRQAIVEKVGRLCDLSRFETRFDYALFVSRVLALLVNMVN